MPTSKRSNAERRSSTVSTITRAILIATPVPDASEADVHRSLSELEQLVLGLNIQVTEKIIRKRSTRTSPAHLGEGKLRELSALTGGSGEVARGPHAPREREAPQNLVVIFDDELTPSQMRNVQSAFGVDVLDRTAVVLRVFEERARTREAKLEIELARLEYELPRIRDDHALGDREGGGGRASRGHTNVELAKQRARDRMATVRRELEHLAGAAERRRAGQRDEFRVALVGYTNAGKSSIMRQLTGAEVLVEDKLFATLGTTVRTLSPATTPPVLVADTVGFMHRLPHALVASFRSTLSEARDASLLLQVVDAADPAFRAQMAVTEQVLSEIGAGRTPKLLLLNKADRLSTTEHTALATEYPGAILMNALEQKSGMTLRAHIEAFFAPHLVKETFTVPYARQGALAELRDHVQVIHEEYGENIVITVRGTREVLGRLGARLAGR